MGTIYLICLAVGGFFVLLSLLGGLGTDVEVEFDGDMDVDLDIDGGGAIASIADFLSLRFAFLFAAFFGLTGYLLGLNGTEEPRRFLISLALGFLIGFVGNWTIKKFAYKSVSSNLTDQDFVGKTAKVIVPFSGEERGKIKLEAKGQEALLIASSADEVSTSFEVGDEVVVVTIDGATAHVIKPT